jgi:hypothetical protein
MFPVIVCIAKKERDYIEEFVQYHLALGFSHIFIYDNEDIPTYATLLHKYTKSITIFHLPGKHVNGTPIQYVALAHFTQQIMDLPNITHVAHIDIDEFIVLKKHDNICDFIREYIVGDCVGIGMNWRFFGSSNLAQKSDEPATLRFTMCESKGNMNIKTLFDKRYCVRYNTPHDIALRGGNIYTTRGDIIAGPFNRQIDFSVIQLNHYKSKTLPEFRSIRARGRADAHETTPENVDEDFRQYDQNEVYDFTARDFYTKVREVAESVAQAVRSKSAIFGRDEVSYENPCTPSTSPPASPPASPPEYFTNSRTKIEYLRSSTELVNSTYSTSLTIGYQIRHQ